MIMETKELYPEVRVDVRLIRRRKSHNHSRNPVSGGRNLHHLCWQDPFSGQVARGRLYQKGELQFLFPCCYLSCVKCDYHYSPEPILAKMRLFSTNTEQYEIV